MKELQTILANLQHAARAHGASIGGGVFDRRECDRASVQLSAIVNVARRALDSPGIYATDQQTGETFGDQIKAALFAGGFGS